MSTETRPGTSTWRRNVGRALVAVVITSVSAELDAATPDCDAAYPDDPVERVVCRTAGPLAPSYRDCLITRKAMGDGFIARHALCLDRATSGPAKSAIGAWTRYVFGWAISPSARAAPRICPL